MMCIQVEKFIFSALKMQNNCIVLKYSNLYFNIECDKFTITKNVVILEGTAFFFLSIFFKAAIFRNSSSEIWKCEFQIHNRKIAFFIS